MMQFFLEWAANLPRPADLIYDWDYIKTMTTQRQPGLAGLRLYDPAYAGPSNDPRRPGGATYLARIAASGVVAGGLPDEATAYQNYLLFLATPSPSSPRARSRPLQRELAVGQLGGAADGV